MHFTFRNVNEAFRKLVQTFDVGMRNQGHSFDDVMIKIARKPSRVGEVLQIEEPVIVTYTHPRERVLFNAARDCNPFFHLYEALWMLAGRNDIAPLSYYSSGYAKQVQDGDSLTANGAYGHRWRHRPAETPDNPKRPPVGYTCRDLDYNAWACELDQLKVIINHLKSNPGSRRAVLQMWNVEDDLLKIDPKANCADGIDCPLHTVPSSKDVCCNTHAYFSIRTEKVIIPTFPDEIPPRWTDGKKYLDMTVCNRSNDLIWGMLGANVVHFSILQEYLAAHLGVEVGVYNQMTNNLHVYTERFEPEKWLADKDHGGVLIEYPAYSRQLFPLVKHPDLFDKELPKFVERYSGKITDPAELAVGFDEPFFNRVAQPMMIAYACYKSKDYHAAFACADGIESDEWQVATNDWLNRRVRSKTP